MTGAGGRAPPARRIAKERQMKVKKKRIFGLIACLAFCCFSACGRQALPQGSSPAQTAGPERLLHTGAAPFHMVSTVDITSYGSGNEKGFYEVFENEDHSKNIMYTDYETQKQIYLCAQPNCTHQDERCTSWVAPQEEIVTPVVLDENLLLVHNSTEVAPYIEILNLDGTDKKLLYQFAANTEIVNGIAYNGQAIALMTRQYDNTDPAAVKVRFALVGIRLADQQAAELYAYEPQEGNVTKAGSGSIFLMGTTADGFVCKTILLQSYSTESNDPETIADNMKAATRHEVFLIPFDGTAPKALFAYQEGQGFEMATGQRLFLLQAGDGDAICVSEVDTATATKRVIVPDLKQSNLASLFDGHGMDDVGIMGLVNDQLMLNFEASSSFNQHGDIEVIIRCVSVDTVTRELQENTLTNYYNATKVPVFVLAQAGDYLLVQAEVKNVKPAGQQVFTVERSLGLISKEDYLASKPNYKMIDSIRKAG